MIGQRKVKTVDVLVRDRVKYGLATKTEKDKEENEKTNTKGERRADEWNKWYSKLLNFMAPGCQY